MANLFRCGGGENTAGVSIGDFKTFEFTGGVQTYSVKRRGVYKLEAYGASGASGKGAAGAGGYALGYTVLDTLDPLYVCVGGAGSGTREGYNGGGYSVWSGSYGTGGGGCTSIAKMTGTLKSIGASNKNKVLLVAGGGGGGGADSSWPGGTGGGTNGGNSPGNASGSNMRGYGGTQSAPGACYRSNTIGGFGYGACANGNDDVGGAGGGGGGWYGGGIGHWTGGGGGSGYVIPQFSYNGVTYTPSMTNGKRSGNGWAKITFVAPL